MPLIFAPGIPRFGKLTPHGVVRQIPVEFSGFPIVSAVRDPVERLVSAYLYGDWKKQDALPENLDSIKLKYPNFPHIEFDDFYKLFSSEENHFIIDNTKIACGGQSWSLLNFFCKKLDIKNNQKICFSSWGDFASIFDSVFFLPSNNISLDLHSQLKKFDFSLKDINFIKYKKKSNVSKKTDTQLSSNLQSRIYQQEWLLNLVNNSSGKIDEKTLRENAVKHIIK